VRGDRSAEEAMKSSRRVSRERENFGALSPGAFALSSKQAEVAAAARGGRGAKIPRDINRFTGRASKGRSTNRLVDEAVLERNALCRASGGAALRGNAFRRVRDREGRRAGYTKWG